ncbi:MAG: hypothetical protein PF448_07420 [Bacteroidales bacterium]|jgi:hypothetical protein|nr:hypothetical protein [Bacteroidales bacterium]
MTGQVLLASIPSLIVMFTAIYMMNRHTKKEHDLKRMELAVNNRKIVTPLRFQAYERVIIFLERITPNSIIVRLQTPKMNAGQLHKELLELIRAEYEHNLSQQLYLSSASWEKVRTAKELTIQLINNAADKVKPETNAMELSREIFDRLIEKDKAPTHEAIEALKKEVALLFQ